MRATGALALLSLVGPVAVAGVVAAGPPAAGDSLFAPRWCSSNPAPCLQSATRNSTTVTSADPDWEIQLSEALNLPEYGDYFHFLVTPKSGGSGTWSKTDVWTLTFDTGSVDPRYTEGYAGEPVTTRTDDGDGTWHLTYQAKPVETTDGCDTSAAWPWPCPTDATDSRIELSGEVQERPDLSGVWDGFDVGQSVDGINGIFLEKASDGSRYLSTEVVNSRNDMSSSLFHGQLRFRVPYAMLKSSFDVPNPATLVASSLAGTVNGSSTVGTWNVVNDTTGKALLVDISDLTFPASTTARATSNPVKRIRLKAGDITPTRPDQVVATRTGAHRGEVMFKDAEPRGAKVTGYKVRCESRGGDVVRAAGDAPPVLVTGLAKGVRYDCRVRATSKAGPGRWSPEVRLAPRP